MNTMYRHTFSTTQMKSLMILIPSFILHLIRTMMIL